MKQSSPLPHWRPIEPSPLAAVCLFLFGGLFLFLLCWGLTALALLAGGA